MEEKFQDFPEKVRERMMSTCIPIEPAVAPSKTKQKDVLKLQNNARLLKAGYVKIDMAYSMDWKDLQRYDRSRFEGMHLDDKSMALLKSRMEESRLVQHSSGVLQPGQ